MRAQERTSGLIRQVPAPGKGLIAGLIGGLGGSLAMAAFQGAWSLAVDPSQEPAKHDVAGDAAPDSGSTPSTVLTANALSRAAIGRDVPARHAEAAGRAFHLAFGTGLGGCYGVLVEYQALASAGAGIPFGILQVPFADEWLVPALNLSGSPSRAPVSAHLRTFAAHAVFGLATEWTRRAVRARL